MKHVTTFITDFVKTLLYFVYEGVFRIISLIDNVISNAIPPLIGRLKIVVIETFFFLTYFFFFILFETVNLFSMFFLFVSKTSLWLSNYFNELSQLIYKRAFSFLKARLQL